MSRTSMNGSPIPLPIATPALTAPIPDPEVAARNQAARQTYIDALENGRRMSGRELGARFERGSRWGRERIAEVRAEHARQDSCDNNNADVSTPDGETDENDGRQAAATRQPPISGRTIAWVAFGSGILASVAANMLHAQLITSRPAAWIGSAFWPIALLLAVEVLTRVEWPTGSHWHAVARYGGTGLVALVAAVISYRHMAGLLTAWGEDPINAHMGPLAVDGLMVVASAALLTTNHRPNGRETTVRQGSLAASNR